MSKQAKGSVKIIACVLLLVGLGLWQTNQASGAITPIGQVDPVYDSSDPWDIDDDLIVGGSVDGLLAVSAGSVVNSLSSFLGFEDGATGTVAITGLDSLWATLELLSVGGAGDGLLSVSNQGRVTAEEIMLGGYVPVEGFGDDIREVLDPNAVLPRGTGWINVAGGGVLESDGLSIGIFGNGTMDVNDGGQVVSGWAELGVLPDAVGTATVRDAGSMWTIAEELTVGAYGTGDVTVANAGEVSAREVYIGGAPLEFFVDSNEPYDRDLLPDGTGTVTVTGTDSLLDVTGDNTLYVGYFGDGTLDVNDGGQVQSNMLIAGAGPDAVGTITVDGSGSELEVDEGIILGVWGQGDLTISDGAGVTAYSLQIGGADISDAGLDPNMVADFGDVQGVGTVTVTGAGSTLDVFGDDTLVVGSGGTGTLTVSDGGEVTSVVSFIGGYVTFEDEGETEIATIHGGTGTATVTGAGSTWDNEILTVGAGGEGTLVITEGGAVSANLGIVGLGPDSIGTVEVTGPNSVLDVFDAGIPWDEEMVGTLAVGAWGEGTLTVSGGGEVNAVTLYVGGVDPLALSDDTEWNLGDPNGTGTVTVTGDGSILRVLPSENEVPETTYVGYSGEGTLNILDGGRVESDAAVVGVLEDGVGLVTVDGEGSAWAILGGGGHEEGDLTAEGEGDVVISNGGQVDIEGVDAQLVVADSITVGSEGTGSTLAISGGGTATSTSGTIGAEAESSGTATVTGFDSQWDIGETLVVGAWGTGDLTVSNQGRVTAEEVMLGGYAPVEGFGEDIREYLDPNAVLPRGTGRINVAGDGVLESDGLTVGFFGEGTLDVNDGGQVVSGWAELGVGPDAVGTATVNDASWTIADALVVGAYGTGDLTIANGGEVSADEVFIGGAPLEFFVDSNEPYDPALLPNGTGAVTVTGDESRLYVTAPASLYVGYFGDGTLDVNDGGRVYSDLVVVGGGPDAVGTVTVEDAGSLVSAEELLVGFWGQGDLTVAEGGRVTAGGVRIGGGDVPDEDMDPDMLADFGDPLGTGTVTVTGAGSRLDVGDALSVGYTGHGEMLVSNGGQVYSGGGMIGTGYIGHSAGSTGSVTVTGEGSEWIEQGNLYVGYEGQGELTISDGGYVESANGYIAYEEGSEGLVTVTGEGSLWYNPGQLYIGDGDYGELIISDGGQVWSGGGIGRTAYIGYNMGGIGSVTVTGEGSRWDEQGDLFVGQRGQGSLTISEGGLVTADTAWVGGFPDSHGDVQVTGPNSLWDIGGALTVGAEGHGEMIVSDGGRVLSGGGGPVTAWIGRYPGSTGSVTVTGEGSRWDERGDLYIGYDGQGELTISDGGYVLGNNDTFIGYEEGSDGLITVTGEDSWLVAHGSLYVGGSSEGPGGDGVLDVSDGGTVLADEVTIWQTGALTGDGTVSVLMPTTLHNYGTIAPGGDDIGTLTVEGNVIFHEGSTYDVQIGGTQSDKLVVDGDVTIEDDTTVQVRSVGTVVGTQEYEIIQANSVIGQFETLDTALLTMYFNEIGLEYEPNEPNSVWLWIDAMRFDDPNLVRTYNQTQVAGGLQQIADMNDQNPITAALQMVETDEGLRDNYDQLAGRTRPSLAPVAVAGTSRFMGSISSRLRNPGAVVASGSWNGSSLSGPVGPDGTSTRTSYNINTGGYDFALGNGSPYLSDSKWGIWGKGYGLFGNRDHSVEAPGYDYRTYGVNFGLDYQFTETLQMGLTTGYADTHVNYDHSQDDSDLQTLHFGLYGSYNTGRGYLDSLLAYSDLSYETTRHVDLTSEQLEGDFGGYAFSGYLETGFDWRHVQDWLIQPLVSFQFSCLTLDAYSESGGEAALGFERQNFESYIGSIGAKITKDLLRDSTTNRMAVQFRARWLHEFGDTRSDVNTYFASDPTVVFNIRNERINRNSALLGVGLGAELNENTRLYVDYDTRLNADDTAHLISGGLQYRW